MQKERNIGGNERRGITYEKRGEKDFRRAGTPERNDERTLKRGATCMG